MYVKTVLHLKYVAAVSLRCSSGRLRSVLQSAKLVVHALVPDQDTASILSLNGNNWLAAGKQLHNWHDSNQELSNYCVHGNIASINDIL